MLLPATRTACPAPNELASLLLPHKLTPSPAVPAQASCEINYSLYTHTFDDLPSKPGTMIRNSPFPSALSPEAWKFSGQVPHPGTGTGGSVAPQKVPVGHQGAVGICDAAARSAEDDALLSSVHCQAAGLALTPL